MRKTRLNERIENAVNAFFENSTELESHSLVYAGARSLPETKTPVFERVGRWSRILREIFMFGPGTFALFCGTLSSVFFYDAVGRSFGFDWVATYFLFVFLTYAGAGNIRNLKNIAVPATVISLSLAIVLIPQIVLGKEIVDQYFWHSMYLFPFVLIAAKLVQSLVSDE